MIKEEYVSFEVARLLKDKGFDQKCSKYCMPGLGLYTHTYGEVIPKGAEIIEVPTQAIAMRWLREVHKCYITFTWEFKEYNKNYKPIYEYITWSFNIAIPKYNSARKGDGDYFDLDSDKEYDSYETACEAAIKYCLENLI